MATLAANVTSHPTEKPKITIGKYKVRAPFPTEGPSPYSSLQSNCTSFLHTYPLSQLLPKAVQILSLSTAEIHHQSGNIHLKILLSLISPL